MKNFEKNFGSIKILLIFASWLKVQPTDRAGSRLKQRVMKKVSFDKLVYMGVKMVLDCTPVGMAVAVLAATNNLSAQQAVELKGAIISQLR